jgi:hypothetical protein
MFEQKKMGQELWVCDPVQCSSIPSMHLVLQGSDGCYYPVRLIDVGESSSLELVYLDGGLVSFKSYDNAIHFCQDISHLESRLTYARSYGVVHISFTRMS